jgi:hypothetical protein
MKLLSKIYIMFIFSYLYYLWYGDSKEEDIKEFDNKEIIGELKTLVDINNDEDNNIGKLILFNIKKKKKKVK